RAIAVEIIERVVETELAVLDSAGLLDLRGHDCLDARISRLTRGSGGGDQDCESVEPHDIEVLPMVGPLSSQSGPARSRRGNELESFRAAAAGSRTPPRRARPWSRRRASSGSRDRGTNR